LLLYSILALSSPVCHRTYAVKLLLPVITAIKCNHYRLPLIGVQKYNFFLYLYKFICIFLFILFNIDYQ